ncbi:unnamed protein product [Bursaphelenchus xylophilus]|uniref:(pine wood nematode) hypothetical protein n=1 Tax=Bursaphelenchus xylophilus TaxID=6326 RepID=A0A1I7RMT9_BURXY|nr:unnamed protein product [Bursaphelenchus xylophilus]CAG9125476.1 unnamed protein product [Bursaphelenchus xylophilus]
MNAWSGLLLVLFTGYVNAILHESNETLQHERRSVGDAKQNPEVLSDGPTPPPLPFPVTAQSLADTLSPPLLSSIQFEGEALSQLFSAVKASRQEERDEKQDAMPPAISPHDMLNRFFVEEQKAEARLLQSVTTTTVMVPTESVDVDAVELGLFQEVQELDTSTTTTTTTTIAPSITKKTSRRPRVGSRRKNGTVRSRRPTKGRRRTTTTNTPPQIHQEEVQPAEMEVAHRVHKIRSKAKVPTQQEVLDFFGPQLRSHRGLDRHTREEILDSSTKSFEEIKAGDFEMYLEFFTVTYTDIKVMYYAITKFDQNITEGPHIAYIIDDDNANLWLKNTWYLPDRETERARIFQCTDRFLYYFEEHGMVRLQTPSGFDCSHAYLYGNIMFINQTHFIQLGMNDGYIGRGLKGTVPIEKSKLRDDIQLTMELCFKPDRFCAQTNPINLVTISNQPFAYFANNLEFHVRRARDPSGRLAVNFVVEVHGSARAEEHRSFFFPSDLKTFGGEVDKRFERVALIPLVRETDPFFSRYNINSMTDAEIAVEMERKRV